MPRDGDLGHLECDVAPVAGDLRADLDELLLRLHRDESLIGSGAARCRSTALQLEHRPSHHKGIFFEVPISSYGIGSANSESLLKNFANYASERRE